MHEKTVVKIRYKVVQAVFLPSGFHHLTVMSLKSGATLTLSWMFPNQLLQVLLSNVFKLNAKKPGIMSGLDYFRHGPRRVGYSQKVYIWRCIDINIYIIPIHVQSYRTLSWSLLNCTRLFNQTVDAARGILTCRLGTTLGAHPWLQSPSSWSQDMHPNGEHEFTQYTQFSDR